MKETIKGIEEIKDKIKTDLTLIVNLDKVKKLNILDTNERVREN